MSQKPANWKTQVCEREACRYKKTPEKCHFAHTKKELRSPVRTLWCNYLENCEREHCGYAHNDKELGQPVYSSHTQEIKQILKNPARSAEPAKPAKPAEPAKPAWGIQKLEKKFELKDFSIQISELQELQRLFQSSLRIAHDHKNHPDLIESHLRVIDDFTRKLTKKFWKNVDYNYTVIENIGGIVPRKSEKSEKSEELEKLTKLEEPEKL